MKGSNIAPLGINPVAWEVVIDSAEQSTGKTMNDSAFFNGAWNVVSRTEKARERNETRLRQLQPITDDKAESDGRKTQS